MADSRNLRVVFDRLCPFVAEYTRRAEQSVRAANGQPIDGDGGGPHDSGMEARVARLEEDMKEVKQVLGRLEPMLIRMDERLNHLPDKTFVVTTVVAIVGLVMAAIVLAPYLRTTLA